MTTKANGETPVVTGDMANCNTSGSPAVQQKAPVVKAGGAGASGADDKDKDPNESAGEPVSVATGHVVEDLLDLSLPGMIPVEWRRLYCSAFNDEISPLGRGGWTHAYHQFIDAGADKSVLRLESGRNTPFPTPARGETVFVRRRRLRITRISEDRWEVFALDTRLTSELAALAPGGRALLRSIRDAWGNRIELRYREGRLDVLVDTAGRELRLSHDAGGRVVRVAVWAADAEQQVVEYAYTDEGELCRATDPAGCSSRYVYDGRHRLVEKTRRSGVTFHYRYDDETGRCVKSWGDGGLHSVELIHDLDKRTTTTAGTLEPRIFFWDDRGVVVREQSFDGSFAVDNEYDDDLFPIKETNAAGESRSYEYDEHGNLCKGTDPAGNVTAYELQDDIPSKRIGPTGLVTEYHHDARGALTGVVHPSGVTWSITYDGRGRKTHVHGPDGLALQIEYDAQHNVVRETNARGAVTRFTHDALGRPTSRTDALGRVSRLEYDPLGRPRVMTFPDGTTLTREFDPEGRVTRTIDQLGQVTTQEWAGTGRLVKQTLPDGQSWSFSYDLMERLRSIVNPKREAYEIEYDRAGNIRREITFDGRRLAYQYTRAQRLSRVENPDGTWRAFQYDPLGNVLMETSTHGATRFTRNAVGQILEAVVEEGGVETTVTCERDALGRVTAHSQNGRAVHYEYDARGRRVLRRLWSGETTRYYFDVAGETSGIDHDGHRVLVEHDVLGRETRKHVYAGSVDIQRAYDAMDRLVEQRVSSPSPTGDRAHRLLSRRAYAYDSLGRPRSVADLRWDATHYEHDPVGQVLSAHRGRHHEIFEYDAAGSLQQALGDLDAPKKPWAVAPGNVLLRTESAAYENDENGRRRRVIALDEDGDPTGETTTLRWDCRSRLREVVKPDGTTIRYFYDAFGRRLRKLVAAPPLAGPDGLPAADPPPPRSVDYVWDGNVLAAEVDSERGSRVFVHEPGAFVPLLQQERGQIYTYVNDQVGTPRELLDARGEIAWSATYSVWGSILSEAGGDGRPPSVSTPFRLLGQYHDEETGLHYTWHRYFDPATARWLSPDPLGIAGGNNLFGYNGSPLWQVDPLGLLVETDYPEPSWVGNEPRPMGAEAVITPADLDTGTSANRNILPPGFEAGVHPFHHERGHLIANSLGGDGDHPMNLVTITGGSNHPTMYSSEAQVYALVQAGTDVRIRVTPQYAGDDLIPHSIVYEAYDARTGRLLFRNRILNGYQKLGNKCC